MPAVVRVKRRIDEEPLSSFVLNGKRRRLDEEENEQSAANCKEEISTLLKFAGTIKEQDNTATSRFANRVSKGEAIEMVSYKNQSQLSAITRARFEWRQHQQEQRFRVVNRLRTTLHVNDNDIGNNDGSKEVTIVDIEKHATNVNKTATDGSDRPEEKSDALDNISNLNEASTSAAAAAAAAAITMPTDSDTGYVYDVYIPDDEQQADSVDLMDDNYLRVRPFDDLVYEDRYNDDDDDTFDSEDSNDENYAGNEYPDEDDDEFLYNDEEYDNTDTMQPRKLTSLLQHLALDNGSEFEYDDSDTDSTTSETDSGNEIYGNDDVYCHVLDPEDDSFLNDVDLYGEAYARYKARITGRAKMENEDSNLDDEEKINNSNSSELSI